MNWFVRKAVRISLIFIGLSLFIGCAAWDHGKDMRSVTGFIDLKPLEDKVFGTGGQISDDVDVIYLLELGNVYSIRGDFEKSNRVLEEVYRRYTAREEEALLGARKVGAKTVDVVFGEGSREYELADYEKVYLHTIKAMNFLMLGNVDKARVETMRGIERHKKIREYDEFESAEVEREKRDTEREINELRAQMARQEEENRRARKRGRYPRRSQEPYDLDKNLRQAARKAELPPDLKHAVARVRNAYENSFTYLLAALNFSLCEEGYLIDPPLRNANALTDNRSVRNIWNACSGNDKCMVTGRNVYIFAQVGLAPKKKNLTIPFPNPLSETLCQFSMARIKPTPTSIGSIEMSNPGSGVTERLAMLTDMELLPLKEYEEKLPENVTKAVLRVIAQTLRDRAIVGLAEDKDDKEKFLKRMVQVGLSIFNLTVAKADTRTWLTAPKWVSFYSGTIRARKVTVRIRDRSGKVISSEDIRIDPNRVNVINLRCFDNATYVQSRCFGSLGSAGTAETSYPITENLGHMTITVEGAYVGERPTTSSRIIPLSDAVLSSLL